MDGSASRMSRTGDTLWAPRLMREEVGNALLTGTRRQRWSGSDADAAWSLLMRLAVVRVDDAVDLDRAWELSRRYDEHPIYDMLYVACAERLDTTLVTADERLQTKLVGRRIVVGPED